MRICGGIILWALVFGISSAGATPLPAETQTAIDQAVAKPLAESGDQSVSLAIVKGGEIAFAKAYGKAKLSPDVPASAAMRYQIASNSKQVIATAALLLVERGKLSLDDTVARFYPDLTRAKDITLRQLLSHTSGYRDFYAEDYTTLELQKPTMPDDLLNLWARKPLSFEPGTRYQYSNTGFVLMGRIIEKAANQPLFEFLKQNIFAKLNMASVTDDSTGAWDKADPIGYMRHAFGPSRPATLLGRGWSFGAGQLAMTASDLARWDISLIDGGILTPASLKTLTTGITLADGTATSYALGIGVSQMVNGHRRWAHTGGLPGFASSNVTFPDDKAAIAVLTNGENGSAGAIEAAVEKIVLADAVDPEAGASLAAAKALLQGLQSGTIDRTRLTASLNDYFTATVAGDFKAFLAPLGDLKDVIQVNRQDRGGMAHRVFRVTTPTKTFRVNMYFMPDGQIQQCLIE